MNTPRLVAERMVDTIDYTADATLLAQTYPASGIINGVDLTSVGLVPGALVKLTSGGKVALAGSAAGDTAAMTVLGMLMSANQPGYTDPSATSGFSINRAENNRVAVLPLSDTVVEVEAYALKTDAGGANVYAPANLLYRSKYGFITKDSTTQPHTPIGQVLEVMASGTLRVQLFRGYTT